MNESPKLFVNKPKKAQLKQLKLFQQIQEMDAQSSSSSSSSTTAASSSIGGGHGGVSVPPEVPKESFARRYRFIWPLLLTVNLAVGAYVFMRTKKKEVPNKDETASASPSIANPTPTPSAPPTSTVITESQTAPLPVIAQPAQPIPEQQQRELFKWMLEEKRKIKTNDPQEKKRIDEEKAILKQFIRAKSIPTI